MTQNAVYQEAMTRDEGVQQVRELFVKTFGEEPTGVWSAPGRVNLIGEHTDYNGGMALPIALPHRTYAAVKPREDNLVRLASAQESGIRTVDLKKVGPVNSDLAVDGWPAYVVGVIWAMNQSGNADTSGFDIAVDSCVPYGAGLSSSAALEGSIAMAALDLFTEEGTNLPTWDDNQRKEVVQWCIRAENEVAGAPTGGMDQSASLRCQSGHAIALDCKDNTLEQVPFDLDSMGLKLLVIDTKAPHALVDGQYAQRRQTCEEAAEKLSIEYLADITDLDEALSQLSDPIQIARVRHVVTEIARTKQTIELLRQLNQSELATDPEQLGGDLMKKIGELFTASHVSLRDDYEVTCPELDLTVDVAINNGALGARMTGGGFGGSAIALVPATQVEAMASTIDQAFNEAGFNKPVFLVVDASEPAERDRIIASDDNL